MADGGYTDRHFRVARCGVYGCTLQGIVRIAQLPACMKVAASVPQTALLDKTDLGGVVLLLANMVPLVGSNSREAHLHPPLNRRECFAQEGVAVVESYERAGITSIWKLRNKAGR